MKIRIEKRLSSKWWLRIVIMVSSIIISLLFGAILLVFLGISPVVAYLQMFEGAFGNIFGISETLVKAIPLMIMGVGVGLAFRMLLWNVGAEGQYCLGAIGACLAAHFMPWIPSVFVLPLMFVMGFGAGALWGAIPGVLKAWLNTNEIITTLMMNYIGIYFLEFLVYGPWKDPSGYKFPMTAVIHQNYKLPQFGMTRVHFGLIVAIIIIAVFYFIIQKTKWGYEIKVAGENREAARYAGINIKKNIVLVLLISGGIAGLAGMCEFAGIQHRLQHGFNIGYGYTAIIIAWLSKLNPLAVILVSILFAGLMVSGDMLQMSLGVGAGVGSVLQAVILFVVLAGELFIDYRIVIG